MFQYLNDHTISFFFLESAENIVVMDICLIKQLDVVKVSFSNNKAQNEAPLFMKLKVTWICHSATFQNHSVNIFLTK